MRLAGRTWAMAGAAVLLSATAAGAADCAALKDWRTTLSMPGTPHYGTETCSLLTKVAKAFDLLDARDLPNAQARRGRAAKTDTAKAVRTLLAKESMRGPAVNATCRMARDIAAKTGDFSVSLHAIELVTLIDAPQGTCTKSLKGALADNPDAVGILEQAADLCATRKEPHCAQLSGADK